MKHRRLVETHGILRSPPVRGRGLKLMEKIIEEKIKGRPPCGGVD